MKRVIYSENVKQTQESAKPGDPWQPTVYWVLEEQGEAQFHQWGTDVEVEAEGVGTFSTAIIELPDGQVKNVPAEHIRFIV